jgi:hypothetical protein
MSEPFLERLSRFTPDAGGLNRDELIFAAGRRSARPNRGWKTLATLLAATQALSVVLLWPPARPLPSSLSMVRATAPAESTGLGNVSTVVDHAGVWSVQDHLAGLEPEKRPVGDLSLVESGPALRAFAASRTLVVD